MAITEAHRDLSLSTPLGKDALLIKALHGVESISTLFRFELHLMTERPSIDPAALIGQKVTVTLERKGGPRYFNGVVSRFGPMTGSHQPDAYYAEVVPWLWLLTQTSDCRIFQKKSVPDILQEVFAQSGFSGNVQMQLQGHYEPREYCVQYRESDFAFVSRLMEEEGIFYFFKHQDGDHTLVLGDTPGAHPSCPGQASIRYHGAADAAEEEFVYTFRREQAFRSGKYTHRDYHFAKPGSSYEASTPTLFKVGGNDKFEVYDYPGYYADRFDVEKANKIPPDATRMAKLRMQEIEAQHLLAFGTSSGSGLVAGYKFELKEHSDDGLNGTYVITSVRHEATSNLPDSGETTYTNSFSCIPDSVPFRPTCVTPKPLVYGPQTAVVVGSAGEEICVDKFGRIKVQFHWDRDGNSDENSSCWVRVAQNWAGKQWGTFFWPRVGHEVVVVFLEGDPDHPLVVGSVYNVENMPPYELPGNQTQSGIKTRSSNRGGPDNFNELRFEDKKGEEQIYFHAEKDFDRVVEHNDSLKVGSAEADDGSQTIVIWKDRTATLKKGNDTLTIELGDQSTDVKAGQSSTTALKKIVLKVGSNSLTIDQKGITLSGLTVKVEGITKADLTSPMTTVKGDGMLTLNGGMTMIN